MPTLDLMNAIVISSATPFMLDFGDELSGQGSGDVRVKNLRPALWRANFTCQIMTRAEARQVRAIINALDGSRGTFYAWDPMSPWPAADPRGVILGASDVEILSIGGDNRSLALDGLPAGYTLTIGDMLAFDYGTPTRRALHEVAESISANGSGVTAEFAVNPAIRPGAVANTDVTLVHAAAEMMIVPGSFDPRVDGVVSNLSFGLRQVL